MKTQQAGSALVTIMIILFVLAMLLTYRLHRLVLLKQTAMLRARAVQHELLLKGLSEYSRALIKKNKVLIKQEAQRGGGTWSIGVGSVPCDMFAYSVAPEITITTVSEETVKLITTIRYDKKVTTQREELVILGS